MNNIEPVRVVFFQAAQPGAKVHHLAMTAELHFSKKEHLLIIADDDRSLTFVDELLWNYSPELFLPHSIVDAETNEWIALTKVKKNLNHARFVFNLCATPLLVEGPFRTIYDFEDTSSPNKKILSSARFDAYKQANYLIESRQS
jgi:DNA polymerase IIIc chi subunit